MDLFWMSCFSQTMFFEFVLQTLDWRTTTHWNVVPFFPQHNHTYQGCRKMLDHVSLYRCSPIQGILVESREQIGPVDLHLNEDIVPWIGEQQNFEMLDLHFSKNLGKPCWKISRTTFQCLVVLQARGQDLKYCWNLLKQGSQSGT